MQSYLVNYLFKYFWWVIMMPNLILGQTDDIDIFVQKVESNLLSMAKEFEKIYKDRCLSNNCTQSYQSCSPDLPDFECSQLYTKSTCGTLQTGSYVNFTQTTIKTPNMFYPLPKPEDQNSSQIICLSNSLNQQFIKMKKQIPEISYQYFGSYMGYHIMWPGRMRCSQYDPRIRDWYTVSTSGSKNLIIVLDISNSMNINNKLSTAIQALKLIINGLSIHDTVGLVVFSDAAEQITSSLLRANKDNQEILIQKIQDLKAYGQTNYEEGFSKAYSLLKKGIDDEMGNGCENVIIFLSDGKPTVGQVSADALIQQMENESKDLKVKVRYFLFGFGDGSVADIDASLLQKISCYFNGVHEIIRDSVNLLFTVSSYTKLMSYGLSENQVYWTEPYEDSNGRGLILTVNVAVFDRSTNPPFVLGSIGVDFEMNQFQKIISDPQVKSLFNKGKPCSNLNLSKCQMESIRSEKCEKESINDIPCDPIQKTPILCPSSKTKEPFYGLKYNSLPIVQTQGCCQNSNYTSKITIENPNKNQSENSLALILIVIFSSLGIILLLGLAYKCYQKFSQTQIQYPPNSNPIHIPCPIPIQSPTPYPNIEVQENKYKQDGHHVNLEQPTCS